MRASLWASFAFYPGATSAIGGNAPEFGESLAKSKCAICHAVGADGASKIAKATAFREFVAATATSKLGEALDAKLSRGHAGLPALTQSEIEGLAAYLEWLKADVTAKAK